MHRKMFILTIVMTLLALYINVYSAMAQAPEPPGDIEAPCPRCQQSPDGHWYIPKNARFSTEASILAPQETGGPDDFGYTWDDSVPLNWIDVSGGIETGINSNTDHVGPVNIGFSFKYYENVYAQLYISRFGFVAFNDNGIYESQSRIPSPSLPNDVVAPHWVPAYELNGYVRYMQGGTAPNRWFVVEWNRLTADCGGDEVPDEYTFELILHENGDIVLQYGTINIGGDCRMCEASGIENSTGLDGLSITDFCREVASNHAVHIYRPAPSARVSIPSLYQGRFTRAGEMNTFQITIYNTGELGADTYDLTTSSKWPAALYAADATTPLSDTDGDDTVDTGSIPQGGSTTVIAKVTTPYTVSMGGHNRVAVNVRSSVDTSKSKVVHLQAAIPAPFAQVFRDDVDGAMSIYLAQPNDQILKKATQDSHYGSNMAVAEMPTSFAYVWSKGRSVDSVYIREIEYTLLDNEGNLIRGVSKLTDHSAATVNTYDYPVVAVAPDGHIGVLWERYLYNSANGSRNYNVFFAVLDSDGNLSYGPVNLTNNGAWGEWNDYGVPQFFRPRIVATHDNRFVLAWEREQRESAGWLEDVYYAIRDTNGGIVKDVIKFTNGVVGNDYYSNPALAALGNNRALLAYPGPNGIAYAVLDSAGNAVKGKTSTGEYGYNLDAVQFSDGAILLAWTNYESEGNEIQFAVLEGTTYNVVAGPTTLDNPAALTGDNYVSVAADSAGHGILTWMDDDYNYHRHLYYALVDSNGNVLTDPTIFRTSQAIEPYIKTSYEGYGNTSWSGDFTPPMNPTSLSSTSHITDTWSDDNTVDMTWSGASDAESGVDGFAVTWDQSADTVPDAVKHLEETVQSHTSDPLSDGEWYFHIRTVDNAGNWAAGAEHVGPFKIDTTSPKSSADSPAFIADVLSVTWHGLDAGSGIVSYDVQVRDGADGTWTDWLEDTTAVSATYTSGEVGHTYYFRSAAKDVVGNVETDLPADGDTHTTVAAHAVEGQVVNNRHQPVFNATVSAEPPALNTATTDLGGAYTLYFDSSETYTLTVSYSGFGVLPPRYALLVDGALTDVDFVLPPEDDAVGNGGWETGTFEAWHSSSAVTSTVVMTGAHTGHYGIGLKAGSGTLTFWPYVTQTVAISSTWSQPTLSFMYRAFRGEAEDALLATVSDGNEVITHTVPLTVGGWRHTWRDLSAFSGQTVTLKFGFQSQVNRQHIYLDEVSIGETEAGSHDIYLPLVLRQ